MPIFVILDFSPRLLLSGAKIKNIFWLIIFLLCLIPAYAGTNAEGYILSVGHIPPSRNGYTFLLVTDLSGSGSGVDISFYNDVGRRVSASHKLLPPNGKIQVDVENYLQVSGTIVLESPGEQISGEYWQINDSGGFKSLFALPLQVPDAEAKAVRYFVSCFRFLPCSSIMLVISDPLGAGPLVQMEFYSKTGELIKVAPKLLRPYSTTAFEVNDYAPWDILGKVSVRSFGGGIVLHCRQLCGNRVVAVPARVPASGLLVDDFSTVRGVTSSLVVTDASAEGPETEISFLSSSGAVLSKLVKILPPNGTVQINPADYVDNISNGMIQIISKAEVIADYWEKNPQTIFDTPAVDTAKASGSLLSISHFSPFDNTQDLLSFLNTGRESVKVEIQFYSGDGKKLGNKEFLLGPYDQIDELMDRYFDGTRLGTVIVKGEAKATAEANAIWVTSHIFDLKNSRHLGKINAQVIR